MKEDFALVPRNDTSALECEDILFNGINEEAGRVKGLNPIRTFCFSIENSQKEILGGVNGIAYYGCLYVDMLWVSSKLRNKGWGTKLMQQAETLGKQEDCSFATVNTMDWEALPFYQKLGYTIEFVREGYQKNSKMYFLKKEL
ncbi:GNAT family N-acetyltransferase [Parachlamydia sp. AcF125]|uniref:GNAT family N-acetyltransferase n=1 Tax=Parachlamydia sp. AcF125 TaxID=2795736 RepID=UPI001BD7FFDE|nr:Acetyltransferase [Parachlamydia sp. AcF125]